jgi:two-component system, NtrC family, sensor kinase
MLKDDDLIGAISVFRQEVRPFTDKQVELLTSFAAQAVIAIENARLLNDLRESLERQTATTEVLRIISSSPGDLQPVFLTMLRNAVLLCHAKFGALFLHENGLIRAVAQFGLPDELREYLAERAGLPPSPGTVVEKVIQTKAAVHVADVAAAGELTSPAARIAGARSYLAVPLIDDGTVVGVFATYRQEARPFTDREIELISNFADQAVIAIKNSHLLPSRSARSSAWGGCGVFCRRRSPT